MTILIRMTLLAVLLLQPQSATRDCKDCKCTKYPVEPKCMECCPVARGVVKAVTPQTLTVSLSGGGEETFNFTTDTVVKGEPKPNASVLAVYSRETKNLGYVRFGDGSATTQSRRCSTIDR
jgi:hypothetical protein